MIEKTKPQLWKPGQSGNPKGKPRGVGKVQKLRDAIAKDLPNILVRMTEAARSGDVGAARLLLERVIPPIKASEAPQRIDLPEGSLTQQGRAVLAAVASGELAPGQGAALVGAIGTLARVAEIDDIERRVAALEKKHGSN